MAIGQRDFAAAALAVLLRLYPRRFREQFGDEMLELYRRRRRRRQGGPVSSRWRGAVGPLFETLWGAPFAWLDGLRIGGSPRPRQGESSMKNLLHEARLSLRVLFTRQRAFTALSVLTLALGLGAATAIFSVVNGVLLAPLPYHEPDRMVRLYQELAGQGFGFFSGANFLDLRDRASSFEAVAAISDYRPEGADLTGGARPERLQVLRVSEGYFESLGLKPVVGRTFTRSEEKPVNFSDVQASRDAASAARDAAEQAGETAPETVAVVPEMPRVVVLSHGFWSQHFGGDADAVGKFLELDRERYEVIAVMPASPDGSHPDIWLPHNMSPGGRNHRGNHYLSAVGRLASGVSIEQATAELERLTAHLREEYPGINDELAFRAVSFEDYVVGPSRPMLWTIFAAVGAMLAVACINVANLFLVRGLGRGQELGIRAALGAGRRRLFVAVLIESFWISALGGVLGLGVAAAGVSWLVRLRPAALPRFDALGLDWPVFLFSASAILVAALALGLLPAARAARSDLRSAFGSRGDSTGGRRDRQLREFGVALQIALSLVLLTAGALLGRSFVALQGADMGFDPGRAQTFQLRLPDYSYGEPEQRVAFYRDFFDRLGAQPEIAQAGATSKLPGSGHRNFWSFGIEGRERSDGDPWPAAEIRCVAGETLRALGIPLLAGRSLAPGDRVGAEDVVLINRALSDRYFPGGDALGAVFYISDFDRPRTVVGIVGDARHDPREEAVPKVYVPQAQFADDRNWDLSFVVTPANPSVTAAALGDRAEAILADLDPRLVLFDRRPLAEIVAEPIARQRFAAQMMVVFAGFSLLLAAIGLFGALAYSLAQRRAEIGVRMALGADRKAVLGTFLWQGLRVFALGAAFGLIGALAAGRWLESQLHGVTPYDPAAFALALVALFIAGVAAIAEPARRASQVDPAQVLNR